MKHILTLCVGNICRSPMAEALLARQFPDKTIWSAGLGALVGNRADPLSLEVAAARGLDLSGHRAKQVTGWMCQAAELILVMEQRHKIELEEKFPLVRGKVFRVGELDKLDIADPHGQSQAAFETAYAQIAGAVTAWVSRIQRI